MGVISLDDLRYMPQDAAAPVKNLSLQLGLSDSDAV